MVRRNNRISVNNDVSSIAEATTVGELHRLVTRLLETVGENARIDFNAGYNNINVTVFDVDGQPVNLDNFG